MPAVISSSAAGRRPPTQWQNTKHLATSSILTQKSTKKHQNQPKTPKSTKKHQKSTKNHSAKVQAKTQKIVPPLFFVKKDKRATDSEACAAYKWRLNLRYHLLAWGQKDKLFTNKSTVPTHAGVSRYTCYWQLHLGDNK